MLRWLNKFEEITSCACLIIMSVVIILQVVFRYCLSASLDWPEELGRFLFIASVYIGASYAEQMDKHLSITILRTSGGPWLAKVLPYFAQIVTVLFSAVMVVWGIRMVLFVHSTHQVAPAMQFPMWIVYLCVPVGMACMGLRAFLKIFHFRDQSSAERQGQ